MKQSCPRSGPFSQPTLRDNLSTSAVSALIASVVDEWGILVDFTAACVNT